MAGWFEEQAHCLLFSGLEGFALRNCTGGLASQGCRSASTLEEVTKPGEADRIRTGTLGAGKGKHLSWSSCFVSPLNSQTFVWGWCGMCSLLSTWASDLGTWAGVDRFLGPALPSLRPSSPSRALTSTSWPSELLLCPGQCCHSFRNLVSLKAKKSRRWGWGELGPQVCCCVLTGAL